MYKSGFGLDSLTMNQGFFLPFSFLAVKWEKAEANAKKKKVKTKKGDFQGKRLTDIWFYKVFLSFLSFINFLFVSLLAFLFYLSQSSFVCLFQDKTEVRVFEVENAGENEKIVEISTGPKGSKKY